MTTPLNGRWPVPATAALLGEILTWTTAGLTLRHLDLVEALRRAGLDEAVARELAPRHAFTRACTKLAAQRIIRQVGEDAATVTFQFTAEHKDGDRFAYDFETLLTLNKTTGQVSCPLPGLATLAQEELDRCIAVRTGADLTRMVQKLFERQADLFPIREQGGAYFTPQAHVAFVDRVQGFLGRLGGRMHRFPVPAGTAHGDMAVKDTVASGIAALIAEHTAAIAGFGEDTRAATLEKAAERIRLTRYKLEAYATLLSTEKGRLEQALAQAADELRARVEALAADTAVGTPSAPPAPCTPGLLLPA